MKASGAGSSCAVAGAVPSKSSIATHLTRRVLPMPVPSMARRQPTTRVARVKSAVDYRPAVRMQDLARHVRGILAGEEQERGCDLVGLAGTAHRGVLAECLELFRARAAARVERGPDRPGGDSVHADALADQVL